MTSALPLGEDGIPCPVIDPTLEELNEIGTVDAACAWAGVDANVRAALEHALGGALTMLRHIVLLR